MLLAVNAMDPTLKMIFFAGAVIFFALTAVGYTWGKASLLGAGLALFAFPFFWDALASS